MRSNKKLLASAKLYLILDAQVLDYDDLLQVLKRFWYAAALDIVQLRDKKAVQKRILDFCRKVLKITKAKIPFIVNDRADLGIIIRC